MTGQGSIAPIAAHTGTGHQAHRTHTEIDDTVVTDFHPEKETTRTLLYGSNFVEVQASTSNTSFGSSQTFTFSNDVDAIGDIWAKISVTLSASATSKASLPDLTLARIIDRAEFMVGNSTWQTMENSDIVAVNKTSMSYGGYSVLDAQARGLHTADAAIAMTDDVEGTTNLAATTVVCWLPLPFFTAGGPSRSHLVAGAPHQTIKVKLTYSAAPSDVSTLSEVSLWARQHVMTNAEREQIRGNTVAKTLYLTQHAEKTISANTEIIELDSFSLLASHLLITLEGDTDNAPTSKKTIKDAELLLNTSSHSGRLEGEWLISGAFEAMGLQTKLLSGPEGDASRREVFCFPIASRSHGPDGCPLNRFDTVRLRLNFSGSNRPAKVYVTAVGTSTAVYKERAASVLYFS